MILTFAKLQRLSGLTRATAVKAWLRREGVAFLRDSAGRPFTTLDALIKRKWYVPRETRTCMTAPLEKPYVTARTAAQALGVPLEAIVADIDAGMDGNLSALFGAPVGGVYYVPAWELEPERLAMHKARFNIMQASRENDDGR